jgi:murein L,D-transpeptidase YafK
VSSRKPTSIRAVLLPIAALVAVAGPVAAETNDEPDRIVVVKSERKLMLMHGETVLRSMNIALGLMPRGPKRQEGDFRTPEGQYVIEAKNPDSDYFLSLKVSYPNASDLATARRLGVDPGGQIMIHGLPNEPKYDEATYKALDWTDGCIAVSNSDMVDLWRLTTVSMPIEIRP